MTTKKRIISLILSLMVIISLAACGNKEEPKEQPDSDVALQDKAETTETENTQTENDSIVGTWVVVKTEVYDGPMKEDAEKVTNTYFPIGSEHQYTADGIYINADGVHSTKYKILDENHLEMTTLVGNIATIIYDYELNGDELVQYGNYSGAYAKYGHSNAVYFKRK